LVFEFLFPTPTHNPSPFSQGAIVHRDLKPGNLMISGSQYVPRPRLVSDVGVVKLADFGLSKSLPKADKHAGYDLDSKFKLTGTRECCVWRGVL
jgi:serine/threonine protein kinase